MEEANLNIIWEQIINNLKEQGQVTEAACKQWIITLKPISISDDEMKLATLNQIHKEYVEKYYIPFIQDAASAYFKHPVNVSLTPSAEALTDIKAPGEPVIERTPEPETKSRIEAPEKIAPGDASTLNPNYTFDSFVIGSSNRFAHAAARAVADSPGAIFSTPEKRGYNPFFIYGGVGLGKTHLMHAIGNEILRQNPNMRVLYTSSETFTNDLINSIRTHTNEEFRQKYRKIDVLMVDDIQFLHDKESTQEEFFHTFNDLYLSKKQIIISSDRPPKEIETLEDRLRSRFECGLITDIQAPDLETRVAILRKKANIDNISVPNDALFYIASRIDKNIRELEGALTRVVAFASIEGRPITTELVAEAMKKLYPTEPGSKNITAELIKEVVASYFNIKAEELSIKKRDRELAFPRQIAMYICRELTDKSLPEIGNEFGGRDHSTVLHACRKITQGRKEDQKLDSTIKELIQRLQKM